MKEDAFELAPEWWKKPWPLPDEYASEQVATEPEPGYEVDAAGTYKDEQ